MAKFRSQKNSLIGGEISSTAQGRTDLAIYQHSCKTLENMIPMLSGGAYRRPGTLFSTAFDDVAGEHPPALISYHNSSQGGKCLALTGPNKTSGGSTANVWLAGASLNTDTAAASATASSISPAVMNSHSYAIATTANGYVYNEAFEVQVAQSADVMWLAHHRRKPRKFYTTPYDKSPTVGSAKFREFDNSLTGASKRDAWPYLQQNATTTTLAPSATTGSITITASAAHFDSTHVGALFKINHGGTIGCAQITAYTSTTVVSATVIVDFGGTGAVTTWWESAWSDYRGWPRAVAFFEQRIGYFGTKYSPDSCWFSQDNNYDVMSVSTVTDPRSDPTGVQPFTVEFASLQLNKIQWASPGKKLVVGTSGDEWAISYESSSTVVGFTCETATVECISRYGSSYNQAVRAGNEIIFSTASGELRAITFDDRETSYSCEPIQTLFDEYPKHEPFGLARMDRKFRKFEWDQTRNTLWCCDTVGNFFGLTREKKLGVNVWHRHKLGGYDSSVTGGYFAYDGSTTSDPAYYVCAGSVITFAVVPSPVLGVNDVWMLVKRKINDVWQYHLERMIGQGPSADSAYSMVLGVSGNYYTDATVYSTSDWVPIEYTEDYTTSGLDHLEGETVTGVANNTHGYFTLTDRTVSNGDVVMTTPYPSAFLTELTVVTWGLPFVPIVIPVRLEAGSQIGSAQGAVKRVHQITLRFFKTLSASVGADANNIEELTFTTGSTPVNYGPEFFTGDKTLYIDCDYDRDGYIYITQSDPLPFAIISFSAEGQTYD